MSHKKGHANSGEWSTGLFGCLTDMESCCITCCCPCISFGRIANILDQGKTSCFTGAKIYVLLTYLTFVGCCFHSCSYRSKLRDLFKLKASPCGCPDCMVHFCCEPCALCQEYRELQKHGFNLAVGWDQNKEARANLNLNVDLNVNMEAHYHTTQTNPVPPEQMNHDDDYHQY